jgi:hypothetical protein
MIKIKSNLNEAIFISKLCVNPTVHHIDPSHYFSLIGTRQPFFSLLNLSKFKYFLRTALLAIESLIKVKAKFIVITKINEPILFLKFQQICKKKGIFLLKDTEVSAGFLTNNLISKKVVLTLFLDATKMELIQKECLRVNCPVVSFGALSSSRSSSSLFVGGNYNSFFAQNFILTLLSISFSLKQDSLANKKIKNVNTQKTA